jgi:uncharacterized membrane protein YraQ (UPF0718 family)
MELKKEVKIFVFLTAVFLLFFFLPFHIPRVENSILEALHLAQWYAREHVVFCLVPAFFIAGAISVFVSQNAVMKYLGAQAKKAVAYTVASVSGTILAVCSCTILPLFAGIYQRGAGLGPATAFLYSGPAINVLAIILTSRILGMELGIARAVGAILFSVIIGLLMHVIFRQEERERQNNVKMVMMEESGRNIWQVIFYFAAMMAVLVFANWGSSADNSGIWYWIYANKWLITSAAALTLGIILIRFYQYALWRMAVIAAAVTISWLLVQSPMIPFAVGFLGLAWAALATKPEGEEWVTSSWGFTKQILPLLFYGVLVAGFLLGRPEAEGMIPSKWVAGLVGGNSLFANFFASVFGAFMYFATLTEVPILQGLLASGMGKGPALALLLAGPALSLPNMLVIRSIMGTKKTVVFVGLVVMMATISGLLFGALI